MKRSKRKPTEPHQSAPIMEAPKLPPTEEQIRQRAHEIFLGRNGGPGNALEDWLIAETELKENCPQNRKAGIKNSKPMNP